MDKNFCPMPFVAISIRSNGDCSPCFLSRMANNTLDATKVSLAESFQSPNFDSLRAQFKNGEKPAVCNRCWDNESRGLTSYRQQALKKYGYLVTEDSKVHVADFAFGNLCNGACVTCGNVSSSLWTEDSAYLEKIEQNIFQRQVVGEIRRSMNCWTDDDLRSLKVLCLFQSETLIQPEFKDFLLRLEKLDLLAGIKFELSTNAGIFPDEEMLQILMSAQSIELQISVDGTEEQFEYLRYPLKWKAVDENTKKWFALYEKYAHFQLRGHFTYSLLNVFEFEKVHFWWKSIAESISLKKDVFVSTGQVTWPAYLRPELLHGISPEYELPAFVAKIILNPSLEPEEIKNQRKLSRDYLHTLDKKRNHFHEGIFPVVVSELTRLIECAEPS